MNDNTKNIRNSLSNNLSFQIDLDTVEKLFGKIS